MNLLFLFSSSLFCIVVICSSICFATTLSLHNTPLFYGFVEDNCYLDNQIAKNRLNIAKLFDLNIQEVIFYY